MQIPRGVAKLFAFAWLLLANYARLFFTRRIQANRRLLVEGDGVDTPNIYAFTWIAIYKSVACRWKELEKKSNCQEGKDRKDNSRPHLTLMN